jgi:hypothetical protein
VIGLVRGVVNGSQDVLAIEEGVTFEDFIEGGPGREKFQHIGDAKALASNAGTPSALALLDCDSAEALLIHRCPLDPKYAVFGIKASLVGLSAPEGGTQDNRAVISGECHPSAEHTAPRAQSFKQKLYAESVTCVQRQAA